MISEKRYRIEDNTDQAFGLSAKSILIEWNFHSSIRAYVSASFFLLSGERRMRRFVYSEYKLIENKCVVDK